MKESPRERVSLDAIRGQLKELGYLKGPLSKLEGWVFAGRGGPSSFLAINTLASLRVALIGGPLLGVPAAIAVVAASRPHIVAARDFLLLGLYLTAMLGAALGLLEFLSDTLLAWLSRRGLVLVGGAEKLAARVGLLFFAATTLYLAYLLGGGRAALAPPVAAHRAGAAWLVGWLVWAIALVGALAVGHLIGRLARIGSLVTLAAAAGAGGLAARTTAPAGRRVLLAAGLLVLMLAAGVLVFGRPWGRGFTPGRPSDFEREPQKGRLVLIGIDGLDAGLFDRMKRRGVCPTLASMEASGARYTLLAEAPRVPPATWTTIATGRPASQHGILGYQAERVPGLAVPVQEDPVAPPLTFSLRLLLPPVGPPPSPVSSGLRRARAVWEILADAGVQTAVVNWWATWPADRDEGIVVSERTFARLVAGQTPDRDASPPTLQTDLASRFAEDLALAQRGLPRPDLAGLAELIQTSGVIDGYHAEVGRRLVSAGLAQAVFVYLPGLDIARARAVKASVDPEMVLIPVLSSLDRWVGRYLEVSGPDDLILMVADPGRLEQESAAGLVLAWGGRVVGGHRVREVSPLDLLPTLLAVSGLPMARDLAGTPAVDFLKVGDVGSRLSRTIESYGGRPEPLPGPPVDPFDREVLDRLRSLGYIQ